MGRIRSQFTYRCVKGHVTTKMFPLGTSYDDYDETTCIQCLDHQELQTAYLVFGQPAEEKKNV